MTQYSNVPPDDDIDLRSLGSALWRAKGRIVALTLLAGAVTFVGLSMMRPLYTSEARILVQNEETAFTRPTTEQGTTNFRTALDEQAVQSQVQVLTSRDLILKTVRDLDLTQNAAFARDAGSSPIARLMGAIGLGGGSQASQEERAANTLAERLNVYQLSNSSVIAVEYTSGDPQLAAQIANKLSEVYIGWQRDARIAQTKDATAWLDAQIKALRTATADSEEAVERFKASEGLYAGSNNVTLNAQQLSELNSQLILAEAQQSEAQARAQLIKKMLATSGDIDATPEVLNSQLVNSLIEQRVLVQRQLAELSATLLPSHPRIQQLRSELADVRAQIRSEAQKVVKSLENEAEIAAAREASLRSSLDAAKSRTAGQSDAEVKLRALEREAKANRDLLESYLASYRDASARHDVGAVPSQAAIVSQAYASVLPSFPRRGPITLLVMAATALLSIGAVLAKTIIVSGGPQRSRAASDAYVPDELVASEPEYMSQAELLALNRMNAESQEPPRRKTSRKRLATQTEHAPRDAKPAVAKRRASSGRSKHEAQPRAQRTGKAAPDQDVPPKATARKQTKNALVPATSSEAKRSADAGAVSERSKQTPPAVSAPAQEAGAETQTDSPNQAPAAASSPARSSRSVWRATKPAKKPVWLSVNEPRSAELDRDNEEEPVLAKHETAPIGAPSQAPKAAPPKNAKSATTQTATNETAASAEQTSARDKVAVDAPKSPIMEHDELAPAEINEAKEESPTATEHAKPNSTRDFIKRFRQDAIKDGETERVPTPGIRRAPGLLARLRGGQQQSQAKDRRTESKAPRDKRPADPQDEDNESDMAALSPNDLRHYLTQRIAASDATEEWNAPADPEPKLEDLGPVLGSLEEVIEAVVKGSTGGLPRTMLVAGTSARSPSPQTAVGIARNLANRNEQVALVDLAKGAAVISGRLNMPRVPGFADLASGSADFTDVVKLDDDSTLQVIPAGNPALDDGYDAPDKFMSVFEALTQTYDCVVLHADMAAISTLMPALKFELPVAVAVLPPRTAPDVEREPLTILHRLGCPVVLYGTGGQPKSRGFSLFGRKAAV